MVAAIAIPITLQSLITIGINMTDTMMVGALGEVPLSGASWPISSLWFFKSAAWALAWVLRCSLPVSGDEKPGCFEKIDHHHASYLPLLRADLFAGDLFCP